MRRTLLLVVAMFWCGVVTANAQITWGLCDSRFENCESRVITLIRTEPTQIDVGAWFIKSAGWSNELKKAKTRGVKVRVLTDEAGMEQYGATHINALGEAGVPLKWRKKTPSTAYGKVHIKAMVFHGLQAVELGSANFSAYAFKPAEPYVNYVDETILLSNDTALYHSVASVFEAYWFAPVSKYNIHWYMNQDSETRQHNATPIPELYSHAIAYNDHIDRLVQAINNERSGILFHEYIFTNTRVKDALMAAKARGIPIRGMFELDAYNNYATMKPVIDGLKASEVPLKKRIHQGLSHEKLWIFHSQKLSVFGSENAGSQDSIGLGLFSKSVTHYNWFVNHFNAKWNATLEFADF